MNYQNIPGYSAKYERDCSQRWELIKNELPAGGVALDVGAAEGYFCKKIAEETGLLAVGIEKHKGRVAFQQRWLGPEYIGRVISCCGSIGAGLAGKIAQTPEFIDVTLLLSVLHWINSDEFLRAVSQFSGRVIIEIPDLNDHNSTGQRFLDKVRRVGSEKEYFEQVTGRPVRFLGRIKAHTYPYRNVWIIEGDFTRVTRVPHIDYETTKGYTYTQRFTGGELQYFKRSQQIDWISGINLATLRQLGIVWPGRDYWLAKLKKSLQDIEPELIGPDMRIHNVIVSLGKLSWIDLERRKNDGRNTIFKDIETLVKNI